VTISPNDLVATLSTVGLNSKASAIVAKATALTFPQATLIEVPSLDHAIKLGPAGGNEILILGEIDRATIQRATSATDAMGLPRWAVVILGGVVPPDSDEVAFISEENWKPQWVAEILTMAARAHILKRENARLRGDLSTVGRRISHDLRSPLSGIYTSCEAINEILAGQTDQHSELTKAILASTDEVIQIIDQVSFVLKASADTTPRQTVAMSEVVFWALQSTESALARKGASVIQPPDWPTVEGVAAWLEIIWLNLIRNALQHTKVCTQIKIGWRPDAPGRFLFWVENGGPIAPQRSAKLLHPFHLLHQIDAPRGLGLPIVQRLTELQGGTSGYELSAGGVRFFFTLPAAKIV
jgi:signal transduction histidine kinase